MSAQRRPRAIVALQWAVGLVVLEESLRLGLDEAAARHFAHAGMPQWLRPALAWSEVAATILFLVPFTVIAGGYILLMIFAIAALLHLLHGEFAIGALIVYGVAVIAVIAFQSPANPEVANDRP